MEPGVKDASCGDDMGIIERLDANF